MYSLTECCRFFPHFYLDTTDGMIFYTWLLELYLYFCSIRIPAKWPRSSASLTVHNQLLEVLILSTYPSNLRRLITLQKRVVRIMSRSAFDAHTDPLFKNLKILNLESIYKLQIGKFMYQYRSGLLPYSFNNMFLVTRQVHSYGTRSSELFYLTQCRTNMRRFSISFQGPKFVNSLSFLL